MSNKEQILRMLDGLHEGISWDKVNINNYAFFLSADDYIGIKEYKGFPIHYMRIITKGMGYFMDRYRIFWNLEHPM